MISHALQSSSNALVNCPITLRNYRFVNPTDSRSATGPIGAVQFENRLTIRPDHVNVLRRVVVGINHHPQAVNSQNGGHEEGYRKPKRLGIVLREH
jgi:hypothetical protein